MEKAAFKAGEETWKRVEDAVKKGRPKTAIQAIEPIIQAALRDKRYAEATKAITMRMARTTWTPMKTSQTNT